MARYAAALLRQGGGIVRPETFAAMTRGHWAPDERLTSWGLAFDRDPRFGHRTFGHGGGVVGGWNTLLTILPDDDLALIVHCNTASEATGRLFSRLLAALLDVKPTIPAGRLDPALLQTAPGVYEGLPGALTNYRIMGAPGRLQIKAENGALRLYARRGPWKGGRSLRPADPDDPQFFLLDDDELEPSRVVLIRDADGAVTGLRCDRLVEMRRAETAKPWA
jgi:hypothetical protein